MKSADSKRLLLKDTKDKIERARLKVAKARAELAKLDRRQAQDKQKRRDTALFTIGAAFAYFHESDDPEDRKIAAAIWEYLRKANSGLLGEDRRRQCILEVFGLDVPAKTSVTD